MNKSERKAFEWLQKQGYTNIVFHSNSTPDFTTDSGEFEVKTLDVNTITFQPNQFNQLSKYNSVHILVCDESDIPIAKIPFDDIKDGQTQWERVRIKQAPPRTHPVKHIVVTLPTYERFMSYQKYCQFREGILIQLMDNADKYLAIVNRRKKKVRE